MSRPKTCATCAHRQGVLFDAVCGLSGYYAITERKNPSVCGINFEGWVQCEPLFHRIAFSLWRRSDESPAVAKATGEQA